jgi:hypothetical protein
MLHFIEMRVYGNVFILEASKFPKRFARTGIQSQETLCIRYVYMVCYHNTETFVDRTYPHTTQNHKLCSWHRQHKCSIVQIRQILFLYIITLTAN